MTDTFAKPYVESTPHINRSVLKWGVPAALAVIVTITAWLLVGGTTIDVLHAPLTYNGDGLLILVMIKRVMDGTWLFHSNLMGAPFGSSLYDYPIPDSGSLFVLKWLGRMSGSPAVAFNLYFLIGFPVNALSAYIVLRKLRLSMMLAFAGGFVFTMLPFHFERLGHLFYTWYFVAPVFVWYAFKIYRGEPWSGSSTPHKLTTHVKYALVLLMLSCFGVYYSFFGVLTFFTAGLMRYLRTRSIKSLHGAAIAIAIVSFGLVLNVAPNLIDRFQHGVNHETAARLPIEAEIYGLKTIQLLLPRSGHRFEPLAKITAKYSATFPLVNENITSSLGFIGSIGFIALLLSFFAPRIRQDTRFYVLAAITLTLLLFCSIGGFSALFAVLISPMIRAWNRVSVFIAFTSITATLLMVEQLLAHDWARRHPARWTAIAAVALCAFAFWDQTTPPCAPCLRGTSNDFDSDTQFVAAIEKQVPRNSTIYQLPYVGFPEVPPVNRLAAYDPAIGYLESKTLNWSWGAMKGRSADLFYRSLAAEPVSFQLEVARRLCFSGIYIDRRGYADNGIAIETQLQQILGKPPLFVSANQQQVFFDLTGDKQPICTLPQNMTPEQIMERADLAVDESGIRYHATLSDGMDFSRAEMPDFLAGLNGLSGAEHWGRWSDALVSPAVSLQFVKPLPDHFVLHLRAQGFGPNAGRPTQVTVGDETQTFLPASEPADYALSFSNRHGANQISIKPVQPTSPSDLGINSDGRKLGLGLRRMWIESSR